MYKILVVDDEPHVVSAIFELLTDQRIYEIEVYKAYSAFEAIAYLDEMRMDIVISDIRMPQKSGLELMEYIRARWVETRIIFLSGYDEFEYIYSAIAKEGVSYILKTEDDDVLLAAVEQAIQAIDQRNQAMLAVDLQESLLRLLRYRDVVTDYVTQHLPYAQFREKMLEIVPEAALQTNVMMMAARLDTLLDSRFDLYARIEHIVTASLDSRIIFLQADFNERVLLWLVQSTGAAPLSEEKLVAQLRNASDRIIDDCSRYWNITASFVITKRAVLWQSIPDEFDHLIKKTGLISNLETGRVVVFDQNDPNSSADVSLPICSAQGEIKPGERQLGKPSLIHAIENYIDCNIAGDLSLTAIGDALHYNASYLSRRFKQLTDGNLLDFIVEKRLEKAVYLLEQGGEPIYCVSRSVGFDNPAYFAKVFRKVHGVPPLEYREKSMQIRDSLGHM